MKLAYSPGRTNARRFGRRSNDQVLGPRDAGRIANIGAATGRRPALAFLPGNRHGLVVGRMDGSLAIYDAGAENKSLAPRPAVARLLLAAVADSSNRLARSALSAASILAQVPLDGFTEAIPRTARSRAERHACPGKFDQKTSSDGGRRVGRLGRRRLFQLRRCPPGKRLSSTPPRAASARKRRRGWRCSTPVASCCAIKANSIPPAIRFWFTISITQGII